MILDELAPLEGKQVLDIGCGKGALIRKLNEHGAMAIGVDPAAPSAGSEASASGLRLERAGAENLPFADRSFDGAIFLNSFDAGASEKLRCRLSRMQCR